MSIQSDGTSVAGSPTSVSGAVGFRDPTALTKWLKIFLWLDITASVIALASKLIELPLLNLEAGNELVLVAYDGNELLKDIIALLRLPILITTIVLFAIWIYRANHNARQLGASGMAFSPGWSVGCYFVPSPTSWCRTSRCAKSGRRAPHPCIGSNSRAAPFSHGGGPSFCCPTC